jgi:hypothetical protein
MIKARIATVQELLAELSPSSLKSLTIIDSKP